MITLCLNILSAIALAGAVLLSQRWGVAAVLVAYAAGVVTTLSSRYEVLKIEREP
jgi:Kef-type K+ transport system membrane component KefB